MISFNHSKGLKECIDLNSNLRSKAKNEFEIDFFKLMNNAVYSNMIENVREHRDLSLLSQKLVEEN